MDTHVPKNNINFINSQGHKKNDQEKLVVGMEPNKNKDTFNPEIYQGHEPSCSIKSQEFILRNFGQNISHEEAVEYCIKHCNYNPDPNSPQGGTPRENVGDLLDACGVETIRYKDATIADIVRELSLGHLMIASVDARELWIKKEHNKFARIVGEAVNKVHDIFDNALGVEGANHSLAIVGMYINPHDHHDIHVVLVDTGSGDYCIEYKWEDFQKAFADSHCHLVATKEAAPYQYNYETHQLEPSGFKSNYIPSMVQLPEGLHNTFVMPDSYYEAYADYEAIFTVLDLWGIGNKEEIAEDLLGQEDNTVEHVESTPHEDDYQYENTADLNSEEQNIFDNCHDGYSVYSDDDDDVDDLNTCDDSFGSEYSDTKSSYDSLIGNE